MIEEIRKEIDKLDDKIIDLLEERLALARKLAAHKTQMTDTKREEEILDKIDSPHIKEIYQTIFKESKKCQLETKKLES